MATVIDHPLRRAANNAATLSGSISTKATLAGDLNVKAEDDLSEAEMSDTQISKDWAERRLSELDHKIDAHRKDWEADVKDMNHKFELLLADFQSESKKNELRLDAKFSAVEASIASAKLQIVTWVIATTIAGSGFALSYWRATSINEPSKTQPPIIINVPPSISAPAVDQVQQTTPKQTKPK